MQRGHGACEPPRMATHAATSSLAAELQRHFGAIRAEAEKLPRAAFAAWPDHAAFHGELQVFPLRITTWPTVAGTNVDHNARLCPQTVEVLEALGAREAMLARMEPGCHVLPGRLTGKPGSQRVHIGIRGPLGAFLRLGAQWTSWRDGMVTSFPAPTLIVPSAE